MIHIISNLPGVIMLAAAFGISFGIGSLIGTSAEGHLMILASPLLIGADVMHRATRVEKPWFHPKGGGMLFYLPIWFWGAFWLVLGIVYSATGQ